jgi:hypothetical protein
MKRELKPAKPLNERQVQEFLNDDRLLSDQGGIRWRRSGAGRWVSSDGLASAFSDGITVEISRTANGDIETVSLQRC